MQTIKHEATNGQQLQPSPIKQTYLPAHAYICTYVWEVYAFGGGVMQLRKVKSKQINSWVMRKWEK